MSRPAGVTASAIVSIIGSAFMLLAAVGMLVGAFVTPAQAPAQPQVPHMAAVASAMAAVLVGLAALGVWTAIGLFKLRSWARLSILVFAGFMTVMSLFTGVTMALAPMPPGMDPGTMRMIRPTIVAMYAVPFAIGIWWLVQFNTKATKDAFAGIVAPGDGPVRPLSISIIGWWSVLGGVCCVIPAVMQLPAFVAGAIVTGWGATLLYAVFAAVNFYIGRGLLALRERARILAIAFYGLGIVNVAVLELVPGRYERLLEYERTLMPATAQQPPIDLGGVFFQAIHVMVVLLVLVVIGFLIRRKQAFAAPAP
jgi:hypothetical protein